MVLIHMHLVAVLATANFVSPFPFDLGAQATSKASQPAGYSQPLADPTVDLDYAVYQGSHDASSDFNVFSG